MDGLLFQFLGFEMSFVAWSGLLILEFKSLMRGEVCILGHFVIKVGQEMKTIEETMSIIHLENNHRKINTHEEIEILKAASSKYLLNDVIAGQSDPMYKLLPSSVI